MFALPGRRIDSFDRKPESFVFILPPFDFDGSFIFGFAIGIHHSFFVELNLFN